MFDGVFVFHVEPRWVTPEWPEQRILQLARLWMQRDPQLSAAAIGERLGCGKSSVVSKAHRIGLPGRPSPIPLDSPTRAKSARPKSPKPWGNRPTLPPLRDPIHGMQSRAGQIEQRAIEHKEPPVIIAAPAQIPMRLPQSVAVLPPPAVRTCQWPSGERWKVTFCGCSQVEPGKPYCEEHARLAYIGYVPWRLRKQVAA